MGFLMMLSRILFSYLSAIKKLRSSFVSVIQGQSILLNEHIQSPLSFGFPKAKIYFPSDSKKWTPREIQMSIAHEKIHVEQNDSLWKLLSLIVQALLFFAPWAYSLHKKLELEMEIFCDEKTCMAANADATEYGSLLLAMTCAQPENLTGNLIFTNMTDSTIKRRFLAMKSSKNTQRSLLMLVLSVVLVLSGATAIAMTTSIADKNKNTFKITSKIFINGKLVSSPVIIALENQKALIVITNTNDAGAQGLRMELVARNVSKYGRDDAIGINYDIQYSNGAEKMHSKPQVIVTPHQEGRINIASDSNHSYEMYVLAEREKNLSY